MTQAEFLAALRPEVVQFSSHACKALSLDPYDHHWHAGPQALTVKTTVPTPCTPPFPKISTTSAPLGSVVRRGQQGEEKLMRKIYVSDSADDKNDGLTSKTPVRSWQRFIELCAGNDEIIIMGADTVKMRLIAEIDKKSRTSQMPTSASS
jgi:hypothetical protein